MRLVDFEGLLYREIGLDSQTIGSNAVARAVQERLTACALSDLEAYWELASRSKAELQELVEAVVVPETWFFRDPGAFEAMTKRAREFTLAENPSGPVRMLSYPCSTGEEPYSIVMSMLAMGVEPGRFAVDAVEISRRSLEIGRRAAYRKHSFRGVAPEWRDRYFTPEKDIHILNEDVRRCVRFIQGNILDKELLPGTGIYDFIFCRNVLIYLDLESRTQVVRIIQRMLKPEGWLFVGPSETALLTLFDFTPVRLPMAFCLRRCDPLPQSAPAAKAPRASPPPKPPAARPKLAAITPPKPATPAIPRPKLAPKNDLDEVERLANGGRLAEAAELCGAHLKSGGASARGHYLMGLIHDVAGRKEAAAAAYKNAIYLDPNFGEALAHLAILAEEQGDLRMARQLKDRLRRVGERTGG